MKNIPWDRLVLFVLFLPVFAVGMLRELVPHFYEGGREVARDCFELE